MNEGPITLGEMNVGDTYSSVHPVTEAMIESFAEATGDRNPLHLDEEFARGTMFGRRVAHGMLTAGILSGVLGTEYPGLGTVYLGQTLKFLRPVLIGDVITVLLEVLVGEAVVMPLAPTSSAVPAEARRRL